MVLMERKDKPHGLGHLDFGHSILFRVSYFVLRICDIKAELPTHTCGVLPECPALWSGIPYPLFNIVCLAEIKPSHFKITPAIIYQIKSRLQNLSHGIWEGTIRRIVDKLWTGNSTLFIYSSLLPIRGSPKLSRRMGSGELWRLLLTLLCHIRFMSPASGSIGLLQVTILGAQQLWSEKFQSDPTKQY